MTTCGASQGGSLGKVIWQLLQVLTGEEEEQPAVADVRHGDVMSPVVGRSYRSEGQAGCLVLAAPIGSCDFILWTRSHQSRSEGPGNRLREQTRHPGCRRNRWMQKSVLSSSLRLKGWDRTFYSYTLSRKNVFSSICSLWAIMGIEYSFLLRKQEAVENGISLFHIGRASCSKHIYVQPFILSSTKCGTSTHPLFKDSSIHNLDPTAMCISACIVKILQLLSQL